MMKIKKAIWIPTLIVVVIAALILTLCLVKVNPVAKTFGDYTRIELLRSNSGSEFTHIIDKDGNDITHRTLKDGLESTKFSVMQAVLEGKFSYKAELKLLEDVEVTITAAGINSYGAAEGEYIVKLYYAQTKTVEIDGKEIKYDRLLVRLYETDGEVQEIECVPYLEYNVDNESTSDEYDEDGRIGSIYYKANVIEIKMMTSAFMADIQELLYLYE